jgi:murein DD-endopeptidase MepM/ murein hydrolase activator NlpD
MRSVASPPAVMCMLSCLIVLALADFRDGEDPLSAAMRPPEAMIGGNALTLASLPADSPSHDPIPTKPSTKRSDRSRTGLSATGRSLLKLALRVDPGEMLVPHDDSGVWTVRHAAAPLERRVRAATGEITTTFTSAAGESGVPEGVVSQVADALGWEFDFNEDLEPGARFRIAYEETVRYGRPTGARLLAAEIQSGGHWYEAYYFAPQHGGEGGYFDAQGHALGRRFLRYPVAYTRISSGFSPCRFHPVLRIHRPHYGVDFAAPTGTPVRAVADGVVARAGWYGSSGRFVKLRHDDTYATAYAHLSRIADGIRPGAQVKRGDTIGYVGESGLATGPHLHYALYIDGKYADPFKAHLPRSRSLHGRRLVAFDSGLTGFGRLLAASAPMPADEPMVTAKLVSY